MDVLLGYEHVSISYHAALAVDNVSFDLQPGEILGIVGESGSGKSTLIRAALGLLGNEGRIDRGSIRFAGKEISSLDERSLRRLGGAQIGMIFQEAGASFCPVRRIEDQLYESARAHERISRAAFRAEALELMGRIGFSDPEYILKSYPFTLSGGMQQRVGVAAAMLLKPKVLLADEPTSALDSIRQRQVIDQLLLVRRLFGTAIVIVTHHIGVVRTMADQVLVMRKGAAIEYGPAGQILNAPREAYTRKLMDAAPRLGRQRHGTDTESGKSHEDL